MVIPGCTAAEWAAMSHNDGLAHGSILANQLCTLALCNNHVRRTFGEVFVRKRAIQFLRAVI